MTTGEFNEKYKDYLVGNHYGLDLENPDVIEYLDKEFQELIKIPGFKYYQIKSKFNWFSFYCDNVPRSKVEEIEETLKTFYK